MSFSVTIEGLSEVRGGLNAAWEELDSGCDRAVLAAVTEGAEQARDKHTYKKRTGNLEDATQGHMTGHAEGEIVALQEYASFVEEGTKPHEIWPKAKRGFVGPLRPGQSRGRGNPKPFLAWEEPQGDWHFASMVHHPGGKPYPFMGPAYIKAEQVLERVLEGTVPDMQRKLDEY